MLHLAAWNLQSSSINSGLNFEFKIKVEKLINLHTPANFVGKTGIQNKKIQNSDENFHIRVIEVSALLRFGE